MRRFAAIQLICGLIPEKTTILTFRKLLEKHKQGEHISETVNVHLNTWAMMSRQGTIVDANLIAVLSSTKSK